MLFSQELLSQWLESKNGKIKTSSYLQYQRTAALIFKEFSCSKVKYEELTNKYSPRTLSYIVTTANQILKFGFRNGLLNNHQRIVLPCKYVSNNKVRILTTHEQKKFTAFLMSDTDASKFGVLLCIYTGIRLGEL